MLKTEKYEFVNELEEIYRDSNSIIVTHYHGLAVSQLTELRNSLRKNKAGFKIIKNTLSKIAATNTGLGSLNDLFSGPVAIAYSEGALDALKGVVEFNKANDNLKIIGGIVNKQIINEAEIRKYASLPSLDELRGKIIGVLQAPSINIIRIFQASSAKVVRVIKAYSDK